MYVCKPCHHNMPEAIEPFNLFPTSVSYIYKVFEYLWQLWIGIWLQAPTVTTTDVSPSDLGELAEILVDVSLQTSWGCRTFQTASHFHVKHIWGVWVPSMAVDGHMAVQAYHYHHTCFPIRVGRVDWNPRWCMCTPCHYIMLEAVDAFKVHHTSMSYIYKVFEAYQHLWIGIWLHKYTITTTLHIFGALNEILGDVSVQTMPLCHDWSCIIFHLHPTFMIYIRWMSTFTSCGCGWAYGCTLTPLPPETFLHIWESRLKS